MDFETWFQYGIEQGWVSRVHEVIPVETAAPAHLVLDADPCCADRPDVYQIRPLTPDIK